MAAPVSRGLLRCLAKRVMSNSLLWHGTSGLMTLALICSEWMHLPSGSNHGTWDMSWDGCLC